MNTKEYCIKIVILLVSFNVIYYLNYHRHQQTAKVGY